MQIDKQTYKVSEINHYKTHNAKTQIIIGTSLRKSNFHILRLQHKDFGKSKKWNAFTISREGTVYQHFDPKYHSDFLGIKEADKKIVSVVLENMGCLFKTPEGKYINWINEECPEENVVEKSWLGYHFWEKFTDQQIQSLSDLCKELSIKFGMPPKCVEFQHYHKDIIKYKGIVFRSNYIEDSSDVNPLFNIEQFNELLDS